MKILTSFKISLLICIGLQSMLLQTAEESKDPDDSIDITAIVNSPSYEHLKDGFDLLHSIHANIPIFYDYLANNLIQNNDQETNFGDVIQNAEGIIADGINNHFYQILKQEADRVQHASQLDLINNDNFDTSRPLPTQTRKIINNHAINGLDFDEIQDPIFQYVMHYKDRFMNPIIKMWIQSNQTNYVKLLHQAIEINHLRLIDFLLSMGINPNRSTFQPLLATAVYFQRPKATELLLLAGANINVEIYNHRNLLIEAAEYDDTATARVLIQHDADLNVQNERGATPLMIATERNNRELVEILLEAGANPNTPDTLQSLTIISFENAHTHITENFYNNELADSLPNFNDRTERDVYGNTPLQIAAENNYQEIAQMLINHGADLNLSNIFHGTALQIAQRNNNTNIRDMLLQAGAIEYTPLPRPGQDPDMSYGVFKNTPLSDLFGLFDNNELFPTLQTSNITENYIFDDTFNALTLEEPTPIGDDQTPAIENLPMQNEVEIPAAPVDDQAVPKIKKRKRLTSSDESQVNESDEARNFENKKSK